MAFTAKLLQIFGQKFYKKCFLSRFLSAVYILVDLGHMTKRAAMPIYGKNPSKILPNQWADCNEILYVALRMWDYYSLFKL